MKSTTKYIKLQNASKLKIENIPILDYDEFKNQVLDNLLNVEETHCSQYFAVPNASGFQFIMIIAHDLNHEFWCFSHQLKSIEIPLESLTQHFEGLQFFEREIHENFNIQFLNHPWLKPIRYANNRADKSKTISNYPFYQFDSTELHEVTVGPIHAGIIEPGLFKFSCHGETVKHLEIQLGWQHRGVEQLFLQKKSILQRTILAESICADTAIAHNTAFVNVMEALSEIEIDESLKIERAIGLEMERIAMHTGDLNGMCTDVAYQLGSSVFSGLRTPLINFIQLWCGNRFGKSLIRVGGTNYPLTIELKKVLLGVLESFEWRFNEMVEKTFNLPSIIKRFDGIGTISKENVGLLGCVGMVAKTVGFKRDVRYTHPLINYKDFDFQPETIISGDVMARGSIRYIEVTQSIKIIKKLIEIHNVNLNSPKPTYKTNLKPNSFAVCATEGWRGEIMHSALTDSEGNLSYYKIKDPSMHNWKAVELSLRNVEISDFPINNKSYDLSYCGHDL